MDEQMKALDPALGGFSGSAFVSDGEKVLLDKGYGVADARSGRKIRADALWDWASVTLRSLLDLESEIVVALAFNYQTKESLPAVVDGLVLKARNAK
jgi:hypothetical protein